MKFRLLLQGHPTGHIWLRHLGHLLQIKKAMSKPSCCSDRKCFPREVAICHWDGHFWIWSTWWWWWGGGRVSGCSQLLHHRLLFFTLPLEHSGGAHLIVSIVWFWFLFWINLPWLRSTYNMQFSMFTCPNCRSGLSRTWQIVCSSPFLYPERLPYWPDLHTGGFQLSFQYLHLNGGQITHDGEVLCPQKP